MKSPVFIGAAVLVSLLAFVVFFYVRPPAGIEPLGDETTTVAYVSLATAIITLIVAVIGLIQKIIEARASRKSER